jgi:hypothetical protein
VPQSFIEIIEDAGITLHDNAPNARITPRQVERSF